jgi:hypothetical protein
MSRDWTAALTFAALPGAASVRFERSTHVESGTVTTQYRLQSFTSDGDLIGDDRDYDLLKAALTPLESLSETADQEDFTVELDLRTGQITPRADT